MFCTAYWCSTLIGCKKREAQKQRVSTGVVLHTYLNFSTHIPGSVRECHVEPREGRLGLVQQIILLSMAGYYFRFSRCLVSCDTAGYLHRGVYLLLRHPHATANAGIPDS